MLDYVEVFLDEKRLSSSVTTMRQYTLILHRYQKYLSMPVEKVKRPAVVRYLNYLMFERKLSHATVANIMSVIKSFYSFHDPERIHDKRSHKRHQLHQDR